MKHEKLVVVLLAAWALLFTRMVKAATLSEFMGSYDWESLQWAAGIALTGGVLRTIITLATDARVVWAVVREGMRDAVVSLIAGGAAYVAIEAARGAGVALSSEVRFAAILVAGVARMSFFTWIGSAGREWLAMRRAQFVGAPAADAKSKDAP